MQEWITRADLLSQLRKMGKKRAKPAPRKLRKEGGSRRTQSFKAEGSTVVIVESLHVNVQGRSYRDDE
jgi:hypothetical protein